MANHMYTYTLRDGKSIDGVVDLVTRFLYSNKMEVQTLGHSECKVIQARVRKAGAKKLLGMDKAIEVRLSLEEQRLVVEMGNAKWADKAVVMAVSMFVMWPLAITSGVGIYKQNELFAEIKTVIDQYFYN
nr:hypothetical protein [Oscillospiraceae bacterium]